MHLKKIIIIAAGVIIIACNFYIGRDDLSMVSKRNGHMIGQWQVTCPPTSTDAAAAANKYCHLSQIYKDNNGKLKAIYHLGFDDLSKLKLISFVFFNDQIALNTLSDFKIANEHRILSFTNGANYCNEQGCQAILDIDEHILHDIVTSKNLKLCVIDVNDLKADYPFEVYGLEHAFKLIKSQILNK